MHGIDRVSTLAEGADEDATNGLTYCYLVKTPRRRCGPHLAFDRTRILPLLPTNWLLKCVIIDISNLHSAPRLSPLRMEP